MFLFFFFFQAEDGIRDVAVTGVQTCALPIYPLQLSRGLLPESSGVTTATLGRVACHRPSRCRLQSMQSVAQGRASSRSTAIGSPQFVQTPYVPSSMRFNAASISARTCSEFSSSV